MGHASRRARFEMAAGPGFSPRDVPEIASGYFWDVAAATGLGTTGFKVPEGGEHSSFDLIQATTANQPTAISDNGVSGFRMRKPANTISTLATSGAVQAGWTGATYWCAWLRLPDASGDITGTTGMFVHVNATHFNRIGCTPGTSGGNDFVTFSATADDVTNSSQRFVNPFVGSAYHFIEQIFDPSLTLGGSTEADRLKFFSDFTAISLSSVAGTSPRPTTLRDEAQIIRMGQSSAAGNLIADQFDWTFIGYGNGIPSLANRVRLANFRNPSGVLLT